MIEPLPKATALNEGMGAVLTITPTLVQLHEVVTCANCRCACGQQYIVHRTGTTAVSLHIH